MLDTATTVSTKAVFESKRRSCGGVESISTAKDLLQQ
jgi:hypothetical protein